MVRNKRIIIAAVVILMILVGSVLFIVLNNSQHSRYLEYTQPAKGYDRGEVPANVSDALSSIIKNSTYKDLLLNSIDEVALSSKYKVAVYDNSKLQNSMTNEKDNRDDVLLVKEDGKVTTAILDYEVDKGCDSNCTNEEIKSLIAYLNRDRDTFDEYMVTWLQSDKKEKISIEVFFNPEIGIGYFAYGDDNELGLIISNREFITFDRIIYDWWKTNNLP